MRSRTGVAVVEVTAPLDSFDFSTAERWEVLVLHDSVPVARVQLPSPGRVDSADLARALLWPYANYAHARASAERLLRARLQAAPAVSRPPPACSVVVCTHGRPEYLPTALAGLSRLNPAPLEVIVVDNDPGDRDCEAEIRDRGFIYVREDRRGLDNARNAGVRAASGDVIVFTDDDCVLPAGWLRHLGEAFADPLVAAVTGPAFPYLLDTPARVRMERQASLTRGLHARTFDWTLISASQAGQVGVGANMAVRGALLRAVTEPFAPELDAGTPTCSGGDTYLFARLLAAGHRIAYDPRGFVFHQHRADWRLLDAAVGGYGTGVIAALAKLLVHDRELEAPRAALWLLQQYGRTQRRRLMRRADAVETRLAWSYIRGGLTGVQAWRRALRAQRAIDPALRPAARFPPPTARPLSADTGAAHAPRAHVVAPVGRSGVPAISVVVPTVDRPETLARCIDALAAQTLPGDAYEVIVVDDAPVPMLPGGCSGVRVIRTAGLGAAAARNAGAAVALGDLLLFLDDDLIATPTLLEHHVSAHARQPPETVVIGYSPPRPPRPGLAALGAALWWEDQFRALSDAQAITFTEALSGNVSLCREAFAAGRGFDPAYARLRREDWEWGYRLLAGGARLHYEPTAVAGHEYELSAATRIRACRAEAGGDVLLAERHPQAASYLPLARRRPGRPRSPRAALVRVIGHPRADSAVVPALAVLERARLRTAWSALYRHAQRAAYAHGLREAGWGPREIMRPPVLDVEASASEPLPLPRVLVPTVRLWHDGRQVARVEPDGAWRPQLAATLAGELAAARAMPAPANGAVRLGARHDVTVLAWPEPWPRELWPPAIAPTPLVAFMLPGRSPSPGWFEALAPAFASPRVALAVGRLRADAPSEPLTLHKARRGRIPYAPLRGPIDVVVLRSDALGALQRASVRAAHGPTAVALACVEDVLRSGSLVAHRDLHEPGPDGPSRSLAGARERESLEAWGALLYEHALAQPPRRAVARTAAMATILLARTVLASHRGGSRALSPIDTSLALAAGYVRAVRTHPPRCERERRATGTA